LHVRSTGSLLRRVSLRPMRSLCRSRIRHLIRLDPLRSGIGVGIGFKKIIMKPELPVRRSLGVGGGEGITWAKGHYDSIHGRISSDWKIEGAQFRWKITVPANTTATVYVPAKDAALVSESGKLAGHSKGVKFLRMEEGRAVYEVGSEKYEFKVRAS